MDFSKQESVNKLVIGLLIATLFIIGFNSLRLSSMGEFVSAAAASPEGITGAAIVSGSGILPTGVPAVYGQELDVSYDDVSSYNPEKTDQTIS